MKPILRADYKIIIKEAFENYNQKNIAYRIENDYKIIVDYIDNYYNHQFESLNKKFFKGLKNEASGQLIQNPNDEKLRTIINYCDKNISKRKEKNSIGKLFWIKVNRTGTIISQPCTISNEKIFIELERKKGNTAYPVKMFENAQLKYFYSRIITPKLKWLTQEKNYRWLITLFCVIIGWAISIYLKNH